MAVSGQDRLSEPGGYGRILGAVRYVDGRGAIVFSRAAAVRR